MAVQELAPIDRTFDYPPCILILELGLLEDRKDRPVAAAAGVIEASLKAMFDDCGATIKGRTVRTVVELEKLMDQPTAASFTHIVIVGHGNEQGVAFVGPADNELIGGSELAALLGCNEGCNPCQIISLCCYSGCAQVVTELSQADNITEVIAPTKEFSVLWADTFVKGYFLKRYSSGTSFEEALGRTAQYCDETPVTVWRDGFEIGLPWSAA